MEIPEKPESPVEFIRENMGCSLKERNQIEFLKEEVEVYKKQVNDLKKEIAGLKSAERQNDESVKPKEVEEEEVVVVDVATTAAKEVGVLDGEAGKQIDGESKKAEEPEPQPASAKPTEEEKVDGDGKAEVSVSAVAQETEAKTEPKTEDKTEDKPAAVSTEDASEPVATTDK